MWCACAKYGYDGGGGGDGGDGGGCRPTLFLSLLTAPLVQGHHGAGYCKFDSSFFFLLILEVELLANCLVLL